MDILFDVEAVLRHHGRVARALNIDVFRYLDYRRFLRDAYRDLKQHQRGFSYRWFARRAGVSSPSFLRLVSHGKRNLSSKTSRGFARALGLDENESSFFCELVSFNQATTAHDKNLHFERIGQYRRHREIRSLDRSQYRCFSRWYIFAIYELVTCQGFVEEPKWIAEQLIPNVSVAEVKEAIASLLEVGLLERVQGRLQQTNRSISTGPEVRSLAVGNFHRQMMGRAAASIELVDRAERDISGVTVSLSPETFQMFKKKIVELRAELLQVSACEAEPTRVIQFNFQLFPLAAVREKEDKS